MSSPYGISHIHNSIKRSYIDHQLKFIFCMLWDMNIDRRNIYQNSFYQSNLFNSFIWRNISAVILTVSSIVEVLLLLLLSFPMRLVCAMMNCWLYSINKRKLADLFVIVVNILKSSFAVRTREWDQHQITIHRREKKTLSIWQTKENFEFFFCCVFREKKRLIFFRLFSYQFDGFIRFLS